MSNTKDTSGPAFPFPAYIYPNGELNHGDDGMTLRDYFAAKAMQTLLSVEGGTLAKDAEMSYKMADEMLKARDQGLRSNNSAIHSEDLTSMASVKCNQSRLCP